MHELYEFAKIPENYGFKLQNGPFEREMHNSQGIKIRGTCFYFEREADCKHLRMDLWLVFSDEGNFMKYSSDSMPYKPKHHRHAPDFVETSEEELELFLESISQA